MGKFAITANLTGLQDDVTLKYEVWQTIDGQNFTKIDEGEFTPNASSFIHTYPTQFNIASTSGNRYYYLSVFDNEATSTFNVQFSFAPITTVMNKDGINTTKINASGDSSFGNLQIGTKTLAPYGQDIESSYLFARGYYEYYYKEFAPTETTREYIYICPYADGWTSDAKLWIDFSALETSTTHHTQYIFQVTLQRWDSSNKKWADYPSGTRSFRRYDVDGIEVNGKDDYFEFSASDTTQYRMRLNITRYSWATDYTIDIYVARYETVGQYTENVYNTLEIDPYMVKGNFYGVHKGTGNFQNFYIGDNVEFVDAQNAFKVHNAFIQVDDRYEITSTGDDGAHNIVRIYYNNITKQPEGYINEISVKWDDGSDERIKHDIEPLDAELSRQFIEGTNPKKFAYNFETEGKHYGMIAQDARKLLDELGETDALLEHGDKVKTINYEEYIPHLINYVKYLKAEIDALKGKEK